MKVLGLSPFLGAISAMIVWAAQFPAVYGAQATACVRAPAVAMLLGRPVVPALVLGVTALSLFVVTVIGLRAWRRLRSGLAGEDPPQFAVWMTAAIALLAGLAIVWAALPVLILRPCA